MCLMTTRNRAGRMLCRPLARDAGANSLCIRAVRKRMGASCGGISRISVLGRPKLSSPSYCLHVASSQTPAGCHGDSFVWRL
ncbi:hypothetical protein GGI42DRAFT_315654, partial [Trichoderma sp. SZMC 28013]